MKIIAKNKWLSTGMNTETHMYVNDVCTHMVGIHIHSYILMHTLMCMMNVYTQTTTTTAPMSNSNTHEHAYSVNTV